MNTADFQTQLTSIMEIMARTAVVEISKLFEKNSLLLRLQISRCTNENESLKQKCHFLENEVKSARKSAGKVNGTRAPISHPGLTDTERQPTIDNVFGKEWCMNLWRHEESHVGQKDDTHLDSSVNTEEPINLLDEETDVIMINEETLKDDSCTGKNKTEEDKSSSLRGSAVTSDERCVAQSSDDFITYTVPSDDQVQLNVHQTPAEEQALDGATHADITTEPDLSPDVGFIPNNLNFNETVTLYKKFKCVFCGKTFEYLSHLTRHMRKHSGEKPYICIVCGKRFAQKTYLTTHQRTHSGERPYSCVECGKSFSQKSSLNVHLRSHTGEKPYSCSHCGKSYAFKIALRTHRC
ncbi:zinc finger protein 33B-like isoform X1 [Carassius auratus]|uniref:Zinc finger protein 33B-like isoform X1 n=1 Tax=Carassius auratus TaxID=7957 RepID=A0A6P6P6I0_CARAU|nr:zinc finger protein 33B-like isoform X1 [Carassius auratus]XP_026116772.1 zinc finger protein 33B-like isoform X1 [Carassius auratus]